MLSRIQYWQLLSTYYAPGSVQDLEYKSQQNPLCLQGSQSHIQEGHFLKWRKIHLRHTHTCRLTHSGQLPECDHCPLDILIFKKKPAHHRSTEGHLEGLNVSCYCFALSPLALISLPWTLACTQSHACRFPHSSGPTWDSTLPPQMPPTQGCGRWACSEHIYLLCRLHFQLPFLTQKGNYATTP